MVMFRRFISFFAATSIFLSVGAFAATYQIIESRVSELIGDCSKVIGGSMLVHGAYVVVHPDLDDLTKENILLLASYDGENVQKQAEVATVCNILKGVIDANSVKAINKTRTNIEFSVAPVSQCSNYAWMEKAARHFGTPVKYTIKSIKVGNQQYVISSPLCESES